jgi:hypothetical protein
VALFGSLFLGIFSANVPAVTLEEIHQKLASARKNLRISIATERRIALELEQLRQSGDATLEIISEYENYLARVKAMVTENQRVLREMEAAYATRFPGKGAPEERIHAAKTPLGDAAEPPHEEETDEVAQLDQELGDSLTAFDEMLLTELELLAEELDRIKAESSGKMAGLAEEAAESAERLREKGVEVETSQEQPRGEADKSAEPSKDTEKGEGEQEVKKPHPPGEGAGSGKRPDPQVAKEDDDIVARQLREAAEKETDPELKERLWKEYEEYKRSTRQ